MNVKEMEIAKLTPSPYNPRKISDKSMDGLKNSIAKYGLVQPIIVNKRTGHVVGGHQRLLAMQGLGYKKALCLIVDIDDINEKALNVALNNPHIAGEFTDSVNEILEEVRLAMPLDFVSLHLDELLKDISAGIDLKEITEDDVPEVQEKTITKKGDVIKMGSHILVCGDSTDVNLINTLLGKEDPKMIFTDPPWNVAIGKDSNPRHRQRKGLENDDLGVDFGDFLHAWTAACLPRLAGDLYCVMGFSEMQTIDKALRDAGMHWSGTIAWTKDVFVLGRSNYQKRWEPIWYGWPESHKSSFGGGRDQDDVWEIPRPKVSKEHPTMKPVSLVAKAIKNSSIYGDVVLDPFGGAGSTLMACDQLGRVCRTIEISPSFCDVIVARWEKASGKKAKR